MSDFHCPAYHPATDSIRDALWADDYFAKHQYAVLFEGDETAYKPEQVAIPADQVFVSHERVRELESIANEAIEIIEDMAGGSCYPSIELRKRLEQSNES